MFNQMMQSGLFLYELSFGFLALALLLYSVALARINLSLKQQPFWLGSAIAAALVALNGLNHFIVAYRLTPQYMLSESSSLLLLIYTFKTVSMGFILLAGLSLLISQWLYSTSLNH